MSYSLFKVLHLLGVAMTVLAIGGVALHAANGGTKENNRSRGLAAALHGAGLLIILGAGFGMLGVGGIAMDGWVHAKLTIWLLLGAAIAIAPRSPAAGKAIWFAVPLLVALSAWLALEKPGAKPPTETSEPTPLPTQP